MNNITKIFRFLVFVIILVFGGNRFAFSDAPEIEFVDIWNTSVDSEVFGTDRFINAYLHATDPDGIGIGSVTAIGPSAATLTLYDDGTHGDEIPGDSEFTLIAPETYFPGDYTFTVVDLNAEANTINRTLSSETLPLPNLLFPVGGEVVLTPTPTLDWEPVSEATGYYVDIWDQMLDLTDVFQGHIWSSEDISTPLTSSEITIPEEILSFGNTYYWSVFAEIEPDNHTLAGSLQISSMTVTPEPISSTLFLIGSAVLGLFGYKKRKCKA